MSSQFFFPNPDSVAERALHTLDIKRVLMFYIDITKSFRYQSNFL